MTGKGKWTVLSRSYHDHIWDVLEVRIDYPWGWSPVNFYLIRKDEQRIPRHLLVDRKVGPEYGKKATERWA